MIAENEAVISQLFNTLGLGDIISRPAIIAGGLINRMYKVTASEGSFAVKVLNPKIMERAEAYSNHIFAERVAKKAKDSGINAIAALEFNGKSVQKYDDSYFLIYNWFDGRVITSKEITIKHCEALGFILAQIHTIDFSEFVRPVEKTDIIVVWNNFYKIAKEKKVNWLEEYSQIIDKLCEWNFAANNAVKRLKNLTVGHRDMDVKNTMWKNDTPFIIDWESAGVINPLIELAECAYRWAADKYGKLQEIKAKVFIAAYRKKFSKPDIAVRNSGANEKFEDAVVANFMGKLQWLEYNLKRALAIESADNDEIALGNKLVSLSIAELQLYSKQIPKLIDCYQN